jgi:regulator of sigma E protease
VDLIYTIAITVVTLVVLVTVHEYGHFWVARRCGVKVLRFSIGFGRPLYSWRDQQDTEYVIASIPLGGYVKMLDEREGEVAAEDIDGAFNRKPVLQRIAVVAAGPMANFALAIVAYWALFFAGETGYAPIIGNVEAGSIAEIAGLEAGQEIIAVDGEETETWQALSFRLLDRIGDSGAISFSVKYPNSDVVYESQGVLERWMADQEQPDLFGGLGIAMYTPDILPVASDIVAGSPAAKAGIESGDKVLNADGITMPLWKDWVDYVRARPGVAIAVELERDGRLVNTELVPEVVDEAGQEPFGRVGMGVLPPVMPADMIRTFDRGPLESLVAGVNRTGEISLFTLNSIGKMLKGLISPKNLSGPITIAKVASASAKSGLESYISFLALLSVSLGVLNLLPIPVLDGGHLMYYIVELLAGRPVPERVQAVGYQLGLFMVLGIMGLALFNDFARL